MTRPRVLVVGQVGSAALTDELALAAVLEVLRSFDCVVVVASPEPEQTRRVHGVASLPSDVPSLIAGAMREADLALLVGDRLISETSESVHIGRSLALVSMARAAGTPILPYGMAVVSPVAPLASRLAAGMVGLMGVGLVPNESSKKAWLAMGGKEPVVAPDLLFALQPPLVRAEERIVVSLRQMPVDDEAAFVTMLARQLDELVASTALPVRFVSLQAGRDDRIHRLVSEAMTTRTEHGIADLAGVLAEFGRARVVITMRDQGVPAAILGGRPVVHLTDRILGDLADSGVVETVGTGVRDLPVLPRVVEFMLGRDADVIDVRDEMRSRMIRARSIVERTLHAV